MYFSFFSPYSDEISTGAAGPPLQGVQIQLINWDEGNYTVHDQPNPRGMFLFLTRLEILSRHEAPHSYSRGILKLLSSYS